MGRAALEGMLDPQFAMDRAAVLEWHLRSNHFPPHPRWMIPLAEQAIDACKAGEYEKLIALPEGVEHRRFGRSVPARELVEALHLAEFLN